jgi:ionotropic glutamate receptor
LQDYPHASSASRNKTEIAKLKVFGDGPKLLKILSQTNFIGLTGPVKFDKKGELLGSTFEIINLVGIGYHKVSYWENQAILFVMPP